MKTTLIRPLYIVFTISILLFLYIQNNLIFCDFPMAGVEENIDYKITRRDVNAWEVIFKNVNVKYFVTSQTPPDHVAVNLHHWNYQWYRFQEMYSGSSNLVDYTRSSNSILESVKAHYNAINRGEFHPDRPLIPDSEIKGSVEWRLKNNRNIRSALDQFQIINLISLFVLNFSIYFTNMGFYLTISACIVFAFSLLAINYNIITSNKWSISQESLYATIHSIVINQINKKDGQKYYPFIYTLFIIILTNNLVGMIPYDFATTSHFILTFFLSFTIVLGSTILGFFLHKTVFFSLFVPEGCPLGLLPLLVLIEFISFLARNVSLGLRLAANILSGHMLLNILSDFTYKIMEKNIFSFILGLIPLMFIQAFSSLELGIAFIQSQVFVVLTSSYIKDSLGLH